MTGIKTLEYSSEIIDTTNFGDRPLTAFFGPWSNLYVQTCEAVTLELRTRPIVVSFISLFYCMEGLDLCFCNCGHDVEYLRLNYSLFCIFLPISLQAGIILTYICS